MIKSYEEFLLQENLQNFEDDYSKATDSLSEGLLKQAIGYYFFFPLTVLRLAHQFLSKKMKIKKMVAKETDPKKKEALKKELKALKYEEVKQTQKLKKKQAEMKAKEKATKAKMTPEEKEKFAKEKAKMQKKIDKEKAKLDKMGGTKAQRTAKHGLV